MFKFCKWYESVLERHTIACIVFCAISFLILLLLLIFPSGIVNAESSGSGSSASTSVIIGDSSSGSSDFWGSPYYNQDGSTIYYKTGLYLSDINDSYFNNNHIKGIKLSDMFQCSSIADSSNVSNSNTHLNLSSTTITVEDINYYLDRLYLVDADKFYQYPYYEFTVDTNDDGYLHITIVNCSSQTYFSNQNGLAHWSEDNGNYPRGWPVFNKNEFIREDIFLDFSNLSVEYGLNNNPDISEYFGFWASMPDSTYPNMFEGPFYYNRRMVTFWSINRVS